MLEPAWLPRVPMKRIIVHWTAGAHTANATDRKAYHILIEGDGTVIRGTPSITKNSGSLKPGYAAHTLNCNTDSIGVSLCSMAGARESPFDPGAFPMTPVQFERLADVVAELCVAYDIAVTPKTVLSHAEVQANLGIAQRAKWDIARLAFERSVTGAGTIGNMLRPLVSSILGGAIVQPKLPPPAGGKGIVTASSLNLRREAGTSGELMGSIPRGTSITLIEPNDAGEWLLIKTPFGAIGWVSAQYVDIVDGPEPVEPTTPDPRRARFAVIRAQLDELELETFGA